MAVCNRVCGKVPTTTGPGLQAMRVGIDVMIRNLPKTGQEPLGQFAEKYSGRKRARYLQALDQVLTHGLTERDAGVTMFIKAEKMSPAKVNPDPRAIQFRDPRYCVVLASYLKPIEEHLYALTIEHPLMSQSRVVGKGLNQVERALLLRSKMRAFHQPVVVSIDMSRFDQHVSVEQLDEEHRLYLACNSDPYFRKILRWQRVNKCVHRATGLRYTTLGKRMSGDMNTALGNCVIVIAMVLGFMLPRGKHFDLLNDGDDCLLIVEMPDLNSVVKDITPAFLEYGHEVKIENIATEIEHVIWCQSQPVYTHLGLKFVRNPWKVMSCALVGQRWNTSPRVRREYLAGLAECELTLNLGVPVLQEYALALARNARGAQARYDSTSGEWFRYLRESRLYRKAARGELDTTISDESRISFSKAFGISVSDQISIEEYLRSWDFSCDMTYHVDCNWEPRTWVNERPLLEFQ